MSATCLKENQCEKNKELELVSVMYLLFYSREVKGEKFIHTPPK